jgi:ubiquinol-cytochrome c reductase cytochrome c1 subunit
VSGIVEESMKMTNTMKSVWFASILIVGGLCIEGVKANVESAALPLQEWTFSGPFGTFDKAQLQRGFQVYKEVCGACHSMKSLSYRNLSALGFSEAEIKAIARKDTLPGGVNEAGELVDRPGLPSDHFHSPYANPQAARAANNGSLPPDLSLIASARKGGPDYIHAYITGYQDPPEGVKLGEGMYYNLYFHGNQSAMAPPLSDGLVTFSDGTTATMDQMSRDVSAYLYWAANPHMEERKQMGVMVLLYMIIFTALMYMTMKRIWSRVEH